jgi:TRAP-type C4-dicarboxylate transport system permease large subunit
MSQITPPVSFNLFVLQSMADKDIYYIAKAAFPPFLIMILAVVAIVLFPELALWLPSKMVNPLL